jgi:hypothetical protein
VSQIRATAFARVILARQLSGQRTYANCRPTRDRRSQVERHPASPATTWSAEPVLNALPQAVPTNPRAICHPPAASRAPVVGTQMPASRPTARVGYAAVAVLVPSQSARDCQ